ncbi:hypothetical protein D3C76_1320190 [compost metagenome]
MSFTSGTNQRRATPNWPLSLASWVLVRGTKALSTPPPWAPVPATARPEPVLLATPGGKSRPAITARSLQPSGVTSLPKKVPQLSITEFFHSSW